MIRMKTYFLDDSAQGLLEYTLIVSLVSVCAVAVLTRFGAHANNSINNTANLLP